ncbi:9848_t:CDS:2 [Funneliformis geosporum]|uniref:9848_t:CDS:1 n=1 Tax=Funneliformis geosporum TaxID=1117311 RepID=A0A9W4SWW1_9GLOM|nr:9848_t:CDS:2 [Funneliformis geosporum]
MSTSSLATTVRQELNRLFLNAVITEKEFGDFLAYISDNPDEIPELEDSLKYGNDNVKAIYLRNRLNRLTKLFRTVFPALSFNRIKTKSTVKSASRRVPNYPVELWGAFLSNAFNASLSINAEDRKFYKPNFPQLTINSEDTTVDLFLEVVGKVNDQRLASLPNPQMWCKRNQAPFVKGEPDIVCIGAPNSTTLHSTNENGVSLIATVEVKPDQLLNNIIQEIIDEQRLPGSERELYNMYNVARGQNDSGTNNYSKYDKLRNIVHQAFGYMVVNDRRYGMITTLNKTWFMFRKGGDEKTLCISPAVSISQVYTYYQASFWECLRYFEDVSTSIPYARSPSGSEPPLTDSDDSDDGDSDNQEDPPPPPPSGKKDQKKKKDPDYNSSHKRKFPSYTGSGVSSRTRRKTKSNATNNTELKETKEKEIKEDILLKYMKNYDRNHFTFGHILGYGRTGSIFEATLGRKTGALKMVALYKDGNKLEELLSEIKIYIGPLKVIQGIHIPRLLKFGVLCEAFVFILTSLAEETFATIGDITRKEKELAIKGLQELHSKGVMHGDVRLENIMVKRRNKGSTSCVWWIDFGWSKMTDNLKELDKELTELKYLLGMVGMK